MKRRRLINSFKDAFRGLSHVFRHEQNFRIQIFFATLVFVAMFVFDIRAYEKIVVWLLIVLVLVLELVNTVIEKFMDLLKPRLQGHVEVIKDLMAAAVLIASLAAFIIGLAIFTPYIIEFIV